MLFFYVKDNTPGCTAETNGIKNHYPKISDRYEIIGINQGSTESHANFCQKHNSTLQDTLRSKQEIAALYHARSILGAIYKKDNISHWT
ncbi:MAG: redoxin domain-containing protein [Nitrosotalea sp.]